MEGKFSKAIEMFKTNQTEILEMKQMVNQIKTTTDTIINRQVHTKESISGMEDKIRTTIQTGTYKGEN